MCVAIKIENVNKSFGETVVLSNVNIEFEKGKVHGLIGRNGSGKTMLMKCICGFVPLSSGQIMINGKTLNGGICFMRICRRVSAPNNRDTARLSFCKMTWAISIVPQLS